MDELRHEMASFMCVCVFFLFIFCFMPVSGYKPQPVTNIKFQGTRNQLSVIFIKSCYVSDFHLQQNRCVRYKSNMVTSLLHCGVQLIYISTFIVVIFCRIVKMHEYRVVRHQIKQLSQNVVIQMLYHILISAWFLLHQIRFCDLALWLKVSLHITLFS